MFDIKKVPMSDKVFNMHARLFPSDAFYCKQDSHFWLVTLRGSKQLVGFAALTLWEDSAFLSRGGVLEPYRGNGLQKELIKIREIFAKRKGKDFCLTYTSIENGPSIKNLLDSGYQVLKANDPHNYWPDTVAFKKVL